MLRWQQTCGRNCEESASIDFTAHSTRFSGAPYRGFQTRNRADSKFNFELTLPGGFASAVPKAELVGA
jgi:hypothetical protein